MNQDKILFKNRFKYVAILAAIFLFIQIPAVRLFAEDEKQATIKLIFEGTDSVKTCKALVTSENKPVIGKEVHFYVKRMFSLLPIGKAVETDDNGEAIGYFPNDLPGDKNGNLSVIVKIEDDDIFGTVESHEEVKWGVHPEQGKDGWSNRSLSASREKAPMYLIIVSNLIIAVIWGTIFYVIYQIFRIRKKSRIIKKTS